MGTLYSMSVIYAFILYVILLTSYCIQQFRLHAGFFTATQEQLKYPNIYSYNLAALPLHYQKAEPHNYSIDEKQNKKKENLLTWGNGRMTNRSRKKPFLPFKYFDGMDRVVVESTSCNRFSGVTSVPRRFILSCSHMFHKFKASVVVRRTVTVTANHPSTKRHMQFSLTERA